MKYGVIASNGWCLMDFSDWAEGGLELDEAEYVAECLRADGSEAMVVDN